MPLSIVDLYRNILRNEGIRGLWAGNGANLIRVFPAKAIVFSSNDMYKHLLRRFSNHDSASQQQQQLSGPLCPLWRAVWPV